MGRLLVPELADRSRQPIHDGEANSKPDLAGTASNCDRTMANQEHTRHRGRSRGMELRSRTAAGLSVQEHSKHYRAPQQ